MAGSNGSSSGEISGSQRSKVLTGARREHTIASYEHPIIVCLSHWLTAVTLIVMASSGLGIFRAFPSFGNKIPEKDFLIVLQYIALGGWPGGALQWHFAFMWLFVGVGILYFTYQLTSGLYRQLLFAHRDIHGIGPMVRHYFFFGPKPAATGAYNPLRKLAYTSVLGLGALAVISGVALYKPVQLYRLAGMLGGFRLVRIWHFVAMCGLLAFLPGHLVMVGLHGWNNFLSMITGWKRNPDYAMGQAARFTARGPIERKTWLDE